MSNDVLTRVWKQSPQKGSALLLTVAIADIVNNKGVGFPGDEYLKDRIRMSRRNTERLIEHLENTGEIYRRIGQGRGNKTFYAVLTGFDKPAIETVLKEHNRYFDLEPDQVSLIAEAILEKRRQFVQSKNEKKRKSSESRKALKKMTKITTKGDIVERKTPTTIEPLLINTNTEDSLRTANAVAANDSQSDPTLNDVITEEDQITRDTTVKGGIEDPKPPVPAFPLSPIWSLGDFASDLLTYLTICYEKSYLFKKIEWIDWLDGIRSCDGITIHHKLPHTDEMVELGNPYTDWIHEKLAASCNNRAERRGEAVTLPEGWTFDSIAADRLLKTHNLTAPAGYEYRYHLMDAHLVPTGKKQSLCGKYPSNLNPSGSGYRYHNEQPIHELVHDCTECERIVNERRIAAGSGKAKATKTNEAKPWSALSKAMYDATPPDIREPKLHYGKHDKSAKTLYEAGFVAQQVTDYVEWAYDYDNWLCCGGADGAAIVIWMGRVEKEIKSKWSKVEAWIKAGKPKKGTNQNGHVNGTQGVLGDTQQLTGNALFKQLSNQHNQQPTDSPRPDNNPFKRRGM